MADAWEQWDELVSDLAAFLVKQPTADPHRRCDQLLAGLPRDVAKVVLRATLLGDARGKIRQQTHDAERAAGRTTPLRPLSGGGQDLFQGKYRHGSSNQRTGATPRGCACERCERVRRSDAELTAQFYGRISSILDDYTQKMRMQWTRELLDSHFSLSDGTLITWGDATVEQHAEREQIFMRNVEGNLQGAARHRQAIDTLRATGAPRLNEAVRLAA